MPGAGTINHGKIHQQDKYQAIRFLHCHSKSSYIRYFFLTFLKFSNAGSQLFLISVSENHKIW